MGRTIRGTRHCQPVDPYSKATAPAYEGNVLIRPLTSTTGRSAPAKKPKARKPVVPAKPRKVGLGAFGNDEDFLRIEKIVKKVSSGGTHAPALAPVRPHSTGTATVAGKLGGKNALAASIEAVLNRRPAEVIQREEHERGVTQQKASATALRKELRARAECADGASDDGAGAGDEELLVTSLRTTSDSNNASTAEVSLAMLDIPLVAVPLSEYCLQPPATAAADDKMTVEPVGTAFSTSNPHPSFENSLVPQIFSTAKPSDGMDVDTPAAPAPLVFASWKPILNPSPVTASPAAPSIKSLHHQATAVEAPAPNAAAVALAVRGRAAALTAGRTRKPKKKRRAELFDYLSDDSEDWYALPSAAPRRPKSGRALDGAEPYNAAAGTVPPIAPELLPATRVAAEKLFPTNYQSALLQRAKEGNVICVLPTGSGKTLVAVRCFPRLYSIER